MLYVPGGVFAGRVYVALALPFETAPETSDDPTGVVPLSTANRTVPPSTVAPELATFATSVKAWLLALDMTQVSIAVVVVAGEPAPDKAMTWGEFGASSVSDSDALRAPPAEG